MAKRKGKSKPRRSKPRFNLVKGAVVPLVMLNATTMGLFGVSARAFITGKAPFGVAGPKNNNSWEITGAELLRSLTGDNSHMSQDWQNAGGLGAAVKYNFKKHGAMMVGTIIAAPIIERTASNLLRSVRTPVNRMLKPAGVMV
tara:strand:- start:740 stop:1168 length:429 start_codon:yes stop_codon:yes gene_type:complete